MSAVRRSAPWLLVVYVNLLLREGWGWPERQHADCARGVSGATPEHHHAHSSHTNTQQAAAAGAAASAAAATQQQQQVQQMQRLQTPFLPTRRAARPAGSTGRLAAAVAVRQARQ